MSSTQLAEIRRQATAAWQEAWWGFVPHTQFNGSVRSSLRWYWR